MSVASHQEKVWGASDLVWFGLLLYAHRHRSISLGAAGHIILTPANQLMVMGLKIWSLSNPGVEKPVDGNGAQNMV
jgi:hypothetical protein